VTSGNSGSGEHIATIGQCIDLEEHPALAPGEALIVQASVKMDAGLATLSLNTLFSDDTRCGSDHVGELGSTSLTEAVSWAVMQMTVEIPQQARSLHLFLWASGEGAADRIWLDDIYGYPSLGQDQTP
jgi:hypothetical protein